MHGGVPKDALSKENPAAVEKGFANLARHVENVHKFGVPVVVCLNRFSSDTEAENETLKSLCGTIEVECITADHWAGGGAGAADLARTVLKTMDTTPAQFKLLYPDDMPLWKKTQTVAREIYGADDIIGDQKTRDRFKELQEQGYGHFPVCIAKTQYSLSLIDSFFHPASSLGQGCGRDLPVHVHSIRINSQRNQTRPAVRSRKRCLLRRDGR